MTQPRATGRLRLAALLALALAIVPAWAGDGRVVVLLGETDAYLAAAGRYWSEQWSPHHVVHGVASLAELREVLATHPLRGDAPWREVVVVSHASEWSGLPVPLYPGGADATPADLVEARRSGAFPGLRRSVLASDSQLRLEGCGIGRRPDILRAIADVLSADGDVRLTASSDLVAYLDDGLGAISRRELPYAARVVRDLRSSAAVSRDLAEEVSAVFGGGDVPLRHEQRPIGVRLPLPHDIAHASTRPERIAARYPTLRRRLEELGFQPGQLRWRVEHSLAGAELVGEAWVLLVSPDVGMAMDDREAP
jgi:hypothetical protein